MKDIYHDWSRHVVPRQASNFAPVQNVFPFLDSVGNHFVGAGWNCWKFSEKLLPVPVVILSGKQGIVMAYRH